MIHWFHMLFAKLIGRNLISTPVSVIIDQMSEKRPLPTGMTEFEEWSRRIISGTLLTTKPGTDEKLLYEAQQFALADMLMHLAPTCDHECDGYFIKSLRKFAVNEIADAKRRDLRDKAKARLKAEEDAKIDKIAEEAKLSEAAKLSLVESPPVANEKDA